MASKREIFLELIDNEDFIRWLVAPTPALNCYWTAWIADNPDKVEVVKEIRDMFNAIKPRDTYELEKVEAEELLGNILSYAQHKKNQQIIPERYTKTRGINWTAWAAIAACLAIVGLLMFNDSQLPEVESVTELIAEHRTILKKNPKGTKSSFYLPDGTLVKLNSSSSLEFPSVFSDSIREVKLRGQAFFEVTRNEAHPFFIRMEEMEVQVLGTSFDVLHDPESGRFEVAVVSGKVSVDSKEGFSEVLVKTEMTKKDLQTGKLRKSKYDPLYQLGWKDGVLVFENTPLKEVFQDLENWYGVDLILDQDLNLNRRFSGAYDKESLENVLIGMSSILDFHFTIDDKKITITHP